MKKNKLSSNIAGIVLFILSTVFCIGALTFLKTCGPMNMDGMDSWMTCHWAGQAIIGVGVVIAVLSVINMIVKNDGVKIGLGIGIAANTVLAILIPGTLIDTCMKAEMQCNAVTRPGVSVLGVFIIVLAVINIIIAAKGMKKEQ